jgi:hypothetical protein
MSPRAIDAAVIAALAAGAGTMVELRKAVGLKPDQAKDAVQRLRWKGMIEFDRLALTPSQIPAPEPEKETASRRAKERRRSPERAAEAREAEGPDDLTHPEPGEGAADLVDGAAPSPPNENASAVERPGGLPAETLLPPIRPELEPAAQGGGAQGDRPVDDRPASPPSPEEVALALLQEIAVWCARTMTDERDLGRWALRHFGYVAMIRKRGRTSPESATIVRAFMAAHPDGLPPGPPPSFDAPRHPPVKPESRRKGLMRTTPAAMPPVVEALIEAAQPTLAEEVKAEAATLADRRRAARSTGHAKPIDAKPVSAAEMIQTIAIADPLDLMRVVNLKHPELWRRAVLLGRATGQRPLQALYAALEAGLDAIEQANG